MSSPDIEINIKVPKGFEFIEIQTSKTKTALILISTFLFLFWLIKLF